MQEKPDTKHQAWLVRQIVGEADQVDRSLALLLRAEQAPPERIRHFWHSRLKGLAQHTTVGALRDTDLKVEEHAHRLQQRVRRSDRALKPSGIGGEDGAFRAGGATRRVALMNKESRLNIVVREPPLLQDMPWKPEHADTA